MVGGGRMAAEQTPISAELRNTREGDDVHGAGNDNIS